MLADRTRMNAQLGTDLAESPAPTVQVGCTLNVHGATVTSRSAGSGLFGLLRRARVTPAMRSPVDGR
jgi:hypothetical protein